jgi:TatD DNase family protein
VSWALPPLDAHAHVRTDIDERELRALRSAVFAVTREPGEWAAAIARRDPTTVWGIGCHPKLAGAITGFDVERFAEAVSKTALIGEVGLDGGSRVPMAEQLRVFRACLIVAKRESRLVSIHSVRAASAVVSELEAVGGVPGAILHWWRGSAEETRRALDLGCYFSLNGAEALRPKSLDLLPPDGVLTETDFPHSKRSDRAAVKPGRVGTIEQALAKNWEMGEAEVRRQVWLNLADLCAETKMASLMPRQIQASLLAAP